MSTAPVQTPIPSMPVQTALPAAQTAAQTADPDDDAGMSTGEIAILCLIGAAVAYLVYWEFSSRKPTKKNVAVPPIKKA